jgi:hypothetical protein
VCASLAASFPQQGLTPKSGLFPGGVIGPESCGWKRVRLAGEEAGSVSQKVGDHVGREVFPPDIQQSKDKAAAPDGD